MRVPRATVVMPAYNVAPFIGEAIQSILDQTFADFELLVIDDGSTDGTVEAIRAFRDPRIRVQCHSTNLGVRATRNAALAAARGEYIVQMDGDDIAHRQRLEKQIAFMDANPWCGACGSFLELFGTEHATWEYPLDDARIKAGMVFRPTLANGTTVVRASVLRRHGVRYEEPGESVAEDWQFWLALKDHTVFANIPEVLLRYRRGHESANSRARHGQVALMRGMYRRILMDLGLSPTPADIDLHIMCRGMFETPPSHRTVTECRRWLNTLLSANRRTHRYLDEAFRQVVEAQWHALFYQFMESGWSAAAAYVVCSRHLSTAQVKHLVKAAGRAALGGERLRWAWSTQPKP
jgi:hypothetical protein